MAEFQLNTKLGFEERPSLASSQGFQLGERESGAVPGWTGAGSLEAIGQIPVWKEDLLGEDVSSPSPHPPQPRNVSFIGQTGSIDLRPLQ